MTIFPAIRQRMLSDGFRDNRKSGSGSVRRGPRVRRTPVSLVVFGLIFLALACSQTAPDPLQDDPPGAGQPTPTPDQVSEPRVALPTPADPPPKADTSITSVRLEDIVFDTFNGRFFRLSEASDEIIGGLRDAINPIYEPKYEPVSGGTWLQPDDIVIGYVSGGEAFAYPTKILNIHGIVNDVIDGVPVLVSYCPLCASGVVYSRDLDGEVLLFGNTSALYESDLVMYDHQTGSYWFQVIRGSYRRDSDGQTPQNPALADNYLEPMVAVASGHEGPEQRSGVAAGIPGRCDI